MDNIIVVQKKKVSIVIVPQDDLSDEILKRLDGATVKITKEPSQIMGEPVKSGSIIIEEADK